MNNGTDINGDWYYPNGYTGYEQYYIDMEGFWRQLYCPEKEFYQVFISSEQYQQNPGLYFIRHNLDKGGTYLPENKDSIYGYTVCSSSIPYNAGYKYYKRGPAEEDSP